MLSTVPCIPPDWLAPWTKPRPTLGNDGISTRAVSSVRSSRVVKSGPQVNRSYSVAYVYLFAKSADELVNEHFHLPLDGQYRPRSDLSLTTPEMIKGRAYGCGAILRTRGNVRAAHVSLHLTMWFVGKRLSQTGCSVKANKSKPSERH